MNVFYTPLCIPVRAPTMGQALLELQKVQPDADLVEIWLDQIQDLQLERLFALKQKPWLCVCKTKGEKGKFTGPTEYRAELLLKVIDLKCEYIDLNIETPRKWLKKIIESRKQTRVILSKHYFNHTPSPRVLERLTQKMQRLGADMIKIAAEVRELKDIATLFGLADRLNRFNIPHIILGMGEKGKVTRIYSSLLNNVWTFAPLEKDQSSAPGQIPLLELKQMWDILGS